MPDLTQIELQNLRKLIDEQEAEKIGQKALEEMTDDFAEDLKKLKSEWWFIE